MGLFFKGAVFTQKEACQVVGNHGMANSLMGKGEGEVGRGGGGGEGQNLSLWSWLKFMLNFTPIPNVLLMS